MSRRFFVVALVLATLSACGGGEITSPRASAPTGDTAVSTMALGSQVPRCADVGHPTAPEDWYGDTPVYVGNEMPVEEVGNFVSGLAGYETVWVDRQHNGWITVGFVGADLEAHQAALREAFPGVGVVTVALPHTADELNAVRLRLEPSLPAGMNAANVDAIGGVVQVWVGLLTAESVQLVAEIAGDDPVCVDGLDPDLVPAPGPQPRGGEGWTYLTEIDAAIGERPVLIADQDALIDAWEALGFDGAPVAVDFGQDVVVAFPVFYSGSCPETRLDEVVVEGDRLAPVVAHITSEQSCTADANPRTYLVGIERSALPAPPFRIARDETGHQITVSADLRPPHTAPADGDVRETEAEPPRSATPTPLVIEVGYPWPFTIDLSCDTGYLGVINGVGWHSAGTPQAPPEWRALAADGLLDVELLMNEGPDPTLSAVAGDHEVVYRPGPDEGPACP